MTDRPTPREALLRSDTSLVLACSAALFVLCAWPLLLVDQPPYQDVPNHLAAAHVIAHPDFYPELIANGWFRTNSALFAWLVFVGRAIGTTWAVRTFVWIVLAVNAIAYPRMLYELRGRSAVLTGALFLAPFVHNWFVSMGMLNFALGAGLSMLVIALMERQRRSPSIATAIGIAGCASGAWWSHTMPLLVLHVLVMIELGVTASKSLADAKHLVKVAILPLLPATVLALASQDAAANGRFLHAPPVFDLFYNLWAEWFYAYTHVSLGTLAPCLVLGGLAIRNWKMPVPFFSPVALVVLAVVYVLLPDAAKGWFYINGRLIPFVWAALIVRVPDRMPRVLEGVLAVATLSYSVSLGVDFVRLARDRAAYTKALPHVAERARLLPLTFKTKGTSDNTRHLSQAWGLYVVAKNTAAPLVFATQPSYAVRYRTLPDVGLSQVELEDWFGAMKSEDKFCAEMRSDGVTTGDCKKTFREYWSTFFDRVKGTFDHLLFWGAGEDILGLVPPAYQRTFAEGDLVLFVRGTR